MLVLMLPGLILGAARARYAPKEPVPDKRTEAYLLADTAEMQRLLDADDVEGMERHLAKPEPDWLDPRWRTH